MYYKITFKRHKSKYISEFNILSNKLWGWLCLLASKDYSVKVERENEILMAWGEYKL